MNSGRIVERRDQVCMTFFSFFSFIAATLIDQVVVDERPFFEGTTHLIFRSCYLFFALRVTMNLSVRLLLRVLKPRVGWPHGVTG